MKPTYVLIDFSLIKLEFEWKKVWQLSLENVSELNLYVNIKIDSPKFLEQLKNLQNKEVDKVCIANEMKEIVFYMIGDCLGIHYSPYDSEHSNYLLSKESLDIMVNVLENHRSKIIS